MRWNASIFAALFLLAGCGGAGGYSDYGAPESAGSPGSPAAQSWGGEGERRPDRPVEAPQDGYQPQPANSGPGASYERPDSGYDRPAAYEAPAEPYADPAAGARGPAGTSRPGAGAERHDEVGYAGVRGVAGGDSGAVVAIHRSLPSGSFVEITSLETGRTIIALVTGSLGAGADHLVDLSPAATRQLGASSESIPVRVRRVTPTGPDQNALLAGRPASDRPDTPPVLLNALRKQLPNVAAPAMASPAPAYGRPATTPRPAAAPAGRGGFYVQIGAFSNAANAQRLAQSLGGFVRPGGGLHRVQLGPYRTAGEAEAARADAARRGYGDARVFNQR